MEEGLGWTLGLQVKGGEKIPANSLWLYLVPSLLFFNAFCSFSLSPFEVQVGPEAGMQKVRAWGPGLHSGIVGRSADFVVESIGSEVGSLGRWKRLANSFWGAEMT